MPRKIDLNWFIPAFVKSNVGSERGATGEDGTKRVRLWQSAKWLPFSGDGSRASHTKSMAIFLEIVQESIPHLLTCPFRTWIVSHTGIHPEKSTNSICVRYSFVQEKVVVVECSRVFFEWGG